MMAVPAEQGSFSPRQHFLAVARAHLSDQLRGVFDSCEADLLESGEQVALCCDLRRNRRIFIDNYLNGLAQRCEETATSGLSGSAAAVRHARTYVYLAEADAAVQALYREQALGIGRLAALWNQQTGESASVLGCPLLPRELTRLFFLLLPDLSAPLRIRHQLAGSFLLFLPRLYQALQLSITNAMQRRGVLVTALAPLPMPEQWEALMPLPPPSVAGQALVVPARAVEKVQSLALEVARHALAGQFEAIAPLLEGQRQTTVLPWLQVQLAQSTTRLPKTAREVLALLAGPLLQAACAGEFSDRAHPAICVMEEWGYWAPGWQERLGIEGMVPEYCRELAAALASTLLNNPDALMKGWEPLLDYLLQLRKRVQQDTSVVVSSTRLSLQVAEVRAEVDALLVERAALEHWPQVVVDILHSNWSSLLLAIYWREGKASDTWLNAIALVDELLGTVQPGLDQPARQRLMQRVPQLLRSLRKGFDELGVDRRQYSALLQRLERVHLALMQGVEGDALPEACVFWPARTEAPASDEPFEVGSWLQQADGSLQSVQFSDSWCTVLLDAHTAALESCSTAALQAAFYEGDLVVTPSPVLSLYLS